MAKFGWATLALALLPACGDAELGSVGAGGAAGAGGAGEATAGAAGASETGGGSEPEHGLRAEYFEGYIDLALKRVEPNLDHVWGEAPPAEELGKDRFSARWTGRLVPPGPGTYTLVTENDDGVRLWIGDELVIDDWRGHFVTRSEAQVELDGEPVPIRIDYFELDLAAQLRLLWSGEGLPEAPVPTESLLPAAAASGLGGPKPPFTNPVTPYACPDPGVIAVQEDEGPRYYAVCTGGRFRIRASRSLVFWEDTDAFILPEGKPAWAANGKRNWAPEIHRVGGAFVAYYTTVNGADVLSIGAAKAKEVLGPYEDIGKPLVEHPDGVIDATFFEDEDSKRYLFYKIDGNAHGKPTPIFARELASDGLSFAPGSAAAKVSVNTLAWEAKVVEAPWVVKRGGYYYMFYSGNVYDHRYRTGVARAKSVLGPYEKKGPPILANNERWVGPGHGSVVRAGEKDYFVYHAWKNAGDGKHASDAGRMILVDRIDWEGGWPKIHDGTPSRTPQPWPGEP